MTRYAVCGECGKSYRAGKRYAAGEPVRRLHEVVSHGGQRVQWRIWGVPSAEDRPVRYGPHTRSAALDREEARKG